MFDPNQAARAAALLTSDSIFYNAIVSTDVRKDGSVDVIVALSNGQRHQTNIAAGPEQAAQIGAWVKSVK